MTRLSVYWVDIKDAILKQGAEYTILRLPSRVLIKAIKNDTCLECILMRDGTQDLELEELDNLE